MLSPVKSELKFKLINKSIEMHEDAENEEEFEITLHDNK